MRKIINNKVYDTSTAAMIGLSDNGHEYNDLAYSGETLYRKRTAAYMDDDVKRLTTDIPDERYGLAFVFRTFERVAYALIVEGSKSVVIGDGVQNP